MCLKTVGVANSVDPDQGPHSVTLFAQAYLSEHLRVNKVGIRLFFFLQLSVKRRGINCVDVQAMTFIVSMCITRGRVWWNFLLQCTPCNLGFPCVSQSVSDCRSRDLKFEPQLGHIIFVETDHGIISTAILALTLIQRGQLSVTGESRCTRYWLPA